MDRYDRQILITLSAFFIFFCLMVALVSDCSKKVATVEPKIEAVDNSDDIAFLFQKPEIKPVERIKKCVIVYFDFDSYEFKLDELWKITNITDTVELKSGCCPIGTEDYNYTLGIKRALSVKYLLEDNGAHVLKYTSIGEHDLITEDPEKYYLNRRCEIWYYINR